METTLTAEDIREIRGMYNLSQRSFAHLLGIGTASLARYEGGSSPSKANANLIRAARHPEFLLECLERDGTALANSQREKATRCAYALISLNPCKTDQAETVDATSVVSNVGNSSSIKAEQPALMDEVYHFTLQQEVLNEQAANLIGEMISTKLSTGFPGEATDVFDDLLDQIAELKPCIVSDETMDDAKLSAIRGYLSCAKDLIARRKLEVA